MKNSLSLKQALSFFVFCMVSLFLASCTTGTKRITDTGNGLVPVDVIVPHEMEKEFAVEEYKEPTADQLTSKMKEAEKLSKHEKKSKKDKKTQKEEKKPLDPNKTPEINTEFKIPNRRPKVDPLFIDEKIVMDVSWLKTRGGEFTLEVLPFKMVNNRKVYHIKGTAKTADFFKFIYRAEDSVESFVDFEGWFPYKFMLKGDETKVIRNYLELFDHDQKKQYVHIINNKIKKGEIDEEKGYKDLVPFSQDSISALYYARTLDLKPGKTFKFWMTANGRQWETEVVCLEREDLETKAGNFKTIKTKVQTYFNGNIQQAGDSFMWFTDDDRKYPVKFDAKVKIGWVTGIAKKIDSGSKRADQL